MIKCNCCNHYFREAELTMGVCDNCWRKMESSSNTITCLSCEEEISEDKIIRGVCPECRKGEEDAK